MARILYLVVFLFLSNFIQGQSLFFIENKIVKDEIPRTSDSYKAYLTRINNKDTLLLEKPGINCHWLPISLHEIIGSNINTIKKIDLSTKKYTTLFKSNNYIVCLTANSQYCYFVLTDNEINRYKNSKLFRINLNDNKIDQINIPNNINFSCFNVSPNNKWLSFTCAENTGVGDSLLDHYLLLNLFDYKVIEIDKAKWINKERFGTVDDGLLSYWIDDDNLFYYKQDSSNTNGYIIKYEVKENKRSKYLIVPEKRLKCFTYFNGYFYFLGHGNIYKYNNNNTKDYIYKCKKQFEYIENGIFIK